MTTSADTIAAIATAPGRGAVGVVRISGARVKDIMAGLLPRQPLPRCVLLSPFHDENGSPIDVGLALYFPAPRSFTGEDVLELQGHGGTVVLSRLLERCCVLGARPAEPGEFTKRAYLNGKMDLAQAEAVADLIDASTTQAARCALRSLSGEFSAEIGLLVEELLALRIVLEANLDFPEEEIEDQSREALVQQLDGVRNRLSGVLEAARQGSLLREGIQIVLVGRPNVGKSSLLNRLAGEDLAIVTDMPGTTRDAIRTTISLEGIPVHVVDTAGLRDAADPVEQAGISRTWAAVQKADLVLVLMDARAGEESAESEILSRLPGALPRLRVMNKADLVQRSGEDVAGQGDALWVSARTGLGMEGLKQALLHAIGAGHAEEGLFLARARHLNALRRALCELEAAAAAAARPELLAEHLRLAQNALREITGEISADDLLGEIFSRFCIGK